MIFCREEFTLEYPVPNPQFYEYLINLTSKRKKVKSSTETILTKFIEVLNELCSNTNEKVLIDWKDEDRNKIVNHPRANISVENLH